MAEHVYMKFNMHILFREAYLNHNCLNNCMVLININLSIVGISEWQVREKRLRIILGRAHRRLTWYSSPPLTAVSVTRSQLWSES